MKRCTNLLSSLRIATLCALGALTPPAWSLDVGALAPSFELPGLKETVKLANLQGKVVYVDFWASWCVPCKQSFPFMNELQARYGAKGLEIVAINLDAKRDDADKFLSQVPAQFTLAFDAKGDSAKRFEVKGMPSSFLVGRDGRVVALHRGFRDEERKEIEALIAQAVGAK